MNPKNLPYVHDSDAMYDDQTINGLAGAITSEYRRNSEELDRFEELRGSVEPTAVNVRFLIPVVSGSIKSDTETWEEALSALKSGDVEAYYEACYDSDKKLKAFLKVAQSDIPERVAGMLQQVDDWTDDDGSHTKFSRRMVNHAHAMLANRDWETGEAILSREYDDIRGTYLRANKASLVLYLMGYNRMCMDTRNWSTLKKVARAVGTPVYTEGIRGISRPATEGDNPYRSDSVNMGQSEVDYLSHSGDPETDGRSFWEDKLKWNIPEYTALTGLLWDELADRTADDVPYGVIPQITFNLSEDYRTTHETVLRFLAE